MSRRRYISTDISIDKRINRLAMVYGDFAALFYTWMIPHATDKAIIHGDPEEIMMEIIPGRRDKTVDDVIHVLEGIAALGMIQWDKENNDIYFPIKTFYKYQPYINIKNRRVEDWNSENALSSDDRNQQELAENTTSLSLSPSLSSLKDHLVPNSDEKISKTDRTLARLHRRHILRMKPDAQVPKNLDKWAGAYRLIRERDKRDPHKTAKILQWIFTDPHCWEGWKTNILSPGKLREKYDELDMKWRGGMLSRSPPKSQNDPAFDALRKGEVRIDDRT